MQGPRDSVALSAVKASPIPDMKVGDLSSQGYGSRMYRGMVEVDGSEGSVEVGIMSEEEEGAINSGSEHPIGCGENGEIAGGEETLSKEVEVEVSDVNFCTQSP